MFCYNTLAYFIYFIIYMFYIVCTSEHLVGIWHYINVICYISTIILYGVATQKLSQCYYALDNRNTLTALLDIHVTLSFMTSAMYCSALLSTVHA